MPSKQPTSIDEALAWLNRNGTQQTIDGMARYVIPSAKALGVTVGMLKAYAKQVGKDHALAQQLWDAGWYEARMLAGFIDEPSKVTPEQMDQWAADFDSWAICDSVCFHLFDRTAPAWNKVREWATADAEFTKRAAFALLWSLTVHDRNTSNDAFMACLPLVEQGALDQRDYVRKGVDMALRAIGKRNDVLREAVLAFAAELASSNDKGQAWVGRSTVRELAKRKAG